MSIPKLSKSSGIALAMIISSFAILVFWGGLLGLTGTILLCLGSVFAGIFLHSTDNNFPRNKTDDSARCQILNACLEANINELKKLSRDHKTIFLDNDFKTLKYLIEGEAGHLIKGNLLQAFCSSSYRANENPFITLPPYYLGLKVQHKLSKQQCQSVLNFLMTIGVKFNRDKLFKQLPLSTAIGFDNNPVALALIELAQKQNSYLLNDATQGRFPCTPLILAIQKGNNEIFDALLKTKKIDINKADSEHGLTPLHWAVIMCLPDMVERLINEGAKTDMLSKQGKRPIDFLKINRHEVEPPVHNGKKQLYATQNPSLKPIAIHFNNKINTFMIERNRKLALYGKLIRKNISSPRAVLKSYKLKQSSKIDTQGRMTPEAKMKIGFKH
ncbi:ankyrin repeat domain-containing protein [Candidatus Berkiella aquae]|uniref:Ankyrin repeat domain-containing protein n=1 Tax=Candidatus Berkiella aquae TaxID=295108 RepID=A0A0Q9YPE0_9GAMM|nr:ankyrin repeat domain-containing protein [Candidatus Berkiella aquae]MCS5711965.1 ankyrin repeat domain-containing protein [Candidatus Berkiella aquae]